ncbi:unnamed protein product [Toxocara canis]|uniref:Uncharacterized protein n=1 Tax=Toxocara canis TaxID=6265 RepID=A0A183V6M2_TOXCA|nr:unnamed protein product [Toxocara canis]
MSASGRQSVVSLVSSTDNHRNNRVETRLMDEGAMLPSSSSKDDDILSESSDEVEAVAMQILDIISEQRKSVASVKESTVSAESEKHSVIEERTEPSTLKPNGTDAAKKQSMKDDREGVGEGRNP